MRANVQPAGMGAPSCTWQETPAWASPQKHPLNPKHCILASSVPLGARWRPAHRVKSAGWERQVVLGR